MSAKKLVAALEKEAILREAAIMEKARVDAQAQLAAAQARAGEIGLAIENLKKDLARKGDNARAASAKMRLRNARLAFGWKIVEAAFQIAGKRYGEFMSSGEYVPFIRSKLLIAMEEGDPAGRVTADPVTAAALAKAGFAAEVDEKTPMGFTLHLAGGRERVHFHFPLALAAMWKQDAPSHYPAIFGEGRDAG
jgi:vacuolar-type H+-ATPase subunit E/Vma4